VPHPRAGKKGSGGAARPVGWCGEQLARRRGTPGSRRARHTGAVRHGPFQNHQRRLRRSEKKANIRETARPLTHRSALLRRSRSGHKRPLPADLGPLQCVPRLFGRANSCLRVDGIARAAFLVNAGGRSTVSLALIPFAQCAASGAPAQPEEFIRRGMIDVEAHTMRKAMPPRFRYS
jgi:hypothetical protein